MNYSVVDKSGNPQNNLSKEAVEALLRNGLAGPNTLAWREDMANWQPISTFAEFASLASGYNPYAASPQTYSSLAVGALSPQEIAELTNRGRERIKQLKMMDILGDGFRLVFLSGQFWPLVLASLLAAALNFVAGLLYAGWIISGALTVGVGMLCLKVIRRQPGASAADVFNGFDRCFGTALLVNVLMFLLGGLATLCFIIPGIYLLVSWSLAHQILADRRMTAMQAMECSRQVISAAWFRFSGLLFLMGLVTIGGFLCLLVGVFVAVAVNSAALASLYSKTLGDEANPDALPYEQPPAFPY
jgi:uncharacterized membrane protein